MGRPTVLQASQSNTVRDHNWRPRPPPTTHSRRRTRASSARARLAVVGGGTYPLCLWSGNRLPRQESFTAAAKRLRPSPGGQPVRKQRAPPLQLSIIAQASQHL
ncbi:hypothetical protein BU23DRAFT_549877 [Bimuria novae-zelandiae CBS 107.79]|uniref:Uncharacterized protein n=1 Tax=Bimuria novae-zelandiae CBS 107.79 TaxID=1447943 RepID=A0A6A5VZ64_9PLEO|nr:hypothetical protein BU23DRAFT_549877 [Bimuria novae-zelandiae CBS 107.79]